MYLIKLHNHSPCLINAKCTIEARWIIQRIFGRNVQIKQIRYFEDWKLLKEINMSLKNYNTGNMKTARELAIEAKESLAITEEKTDIKISHGECGLSNPCVFGEHNPNFRDECQSDE